MGVGCRILVIIREERGGRDKGWVVQLVVERRKGGVAGSFFQGREVEGARGRARNKGSSMIGRRRKKKKLVYLRYVGKNDGNTFCRLVVSRELLDWEWCPGNCATGEAVGKVVFWLRWDG